MKITNPRYIIERGPPKRPKLVMELDGIKASADSAQKWLRHWGLDIAELDTELELPNVRAAPEGEKPITLSRRFTRNAGVVRLVKQFIEDLENDVFKPKKLKI